MMDYKRSCSPCTFSLGKKIKKSDVSVNAQFNNIYNNDDFKRKIGSQFKQRTSFRDESGAETYADPFFSCFLPNFIDDVEYLTELREELLDQEFFDKNNDLYKFQQTDDLKNITSPHIVALRKLLYEDFIEWLKDVTGISLIDTVDMSCSRYNHTDVLLCHDDELEGRRIAFIIYLVPEWFQEDGGTLDLFNTDENGQPQSVIKSFVPVWNSLIFFEVSPSSFHQVSEVVAQDKTRLSISGWFHGPTIPRPQPFIETQRPLLSPGHVEEEMIYEWINPIYLDLVVQGQIQEKFENDSEIELQGFLKEEKFQLVSEALRSSDIQWSMMGPANRRHFERAVEDNLPSVIKDCLHLLESEAMFLILSGLTGLTLHELAAKNSSDSEDDDDDDSGTHEENSKRPDKSGKNSRCVAEIRKWNQGSYTLIHDDDIENSTISLDATLFFNCKGWESSFGGFISYLARGEDEELLNIHPSENSLALVYRDEDSLNFVKYMNSGIEEMLSGSSFHDIHLTYFE